MTQDMDEPRSLRELDAADLPALRGELKGQQALSLLTAASMPVMSLALIEVAGIWIGVLPLLAIPFFMRRSIRAKRELERTRSDGDF